jgi:hypothetical protein
MSTSFQFQSCRRRRFFIQALLLLLLLAIITTTTTIMDLCRPSIAHKKKTPKEPKREKRSQSKPLIFPEELKEMPPFPMWIRTAIYNAIKDGEEIDKHTLHMSMPST